MLTNHEKAAYVLTEIPWPDGIVSRAIFRALLPGSSKHWRKQLVKRWERQGLADRGGYFYRVHRAQIVEHTPIVTYERPTLDYVGAVESVAAWLELRQPPEAITQRIRNELKVLRGHKARVEAHERNAEHVARQEKKHPAAKHHRATE